MYYSVKLQSEGYTSDYIPLATPRRRHRWLDSETHHQNLRLHQQTCNERAWLIITFSANALR